MKDIIALAIAAAILIPLAAVAIWHEEKIIAWENRKAADFRRTLRKALRSSARIRAWAMATELPEPLDVDRYIYRPQIKGRTFHTIVIDERMVKHGRNS